MNIGLSFVEGAGNGLSCNSSPSGDPNETGQIDGESKKSPEDEAVWDKLPKSLSWEKLELGGVGLEL